MKKVECPACEGSGFFEIEDGKEIYYYTALEIKRRRKELKLSQTELAERVGLSRTSIANIELCRQRSTLDQMSDIAKALDCNVKDLLPE